MSGKKHGESCEVYGWESFLERCAVEAQKPSTNCIDNDEAEDLIDEAESQHRIRMRWQKSSSASKFTSVACTTSPVSKVICFVVVQVLHT